MDRVTPTTSAQEASAQVAQKCEPEGAGSTSDLHKGSEVVVPLAEEEIHVEKEQVETGRVRVRKTVHERSEPIDIALYADEVEVERVRVDQVVDSPPAVRREGDTLIVPLVEEVLVKQIIIREEIRIRQKQRELPRPEPQTLRYEQAHIERVSESSSAEGTPSVKSQGQQS